MVLQSHMNNTLFTPQKKFIQQIFSTKENVLNTENGTWNIILKRTNLKLQKLWDSDVWDLLSSAINLGTGRFK